MAQYMTQFNAWPVQFDLARPGDTRMLVWHFNAWVTYASGQSSRTILTENQYYQRDTIIRTDI